MTNTVSRTVSDETLNRIITVESSGNPNARVATSSALGLGQFLNATWLNTVKQHSPESFKGRTQSQVLAMRVNPSFSIEMLARFTEDNQRIVGMDCSEGDLYLAHFLGAGAAKRVYHAPAGADCLPYVGEPAVRANKSILDGKTIAEVRAWAAKRMKQSGGHEWVAKYYKKAVVPALFSSAVPETFHPHGDPDLLLLQSQLKGMNYYTGDLDGLWGGKTSEAISGFINDQGGFMSAPTSVEAYELSKAQIKSVADKAEAQNFKRPVTAARELQDPATVARIAPEVVPVRKSFWTAAAGSAATFGFAVWDTVSTWAGTAWNLFTTNKDNIPDTVKDPTFISNIFHKVPPSVWLFAVAALLGFIGMNAWRSVKKINAAVSTGER